MSALEKALNHSKKIGINECEIIFLKKRIITVRITDSEIIEIKQNFEEDYGIRLIHEGKIASIQTTNPEKIEDTINTALKSSTRLKSRNFWKGLPDTVISKQLKGTVDEKLQNISAEEIKNIAQDMINSANNTKINTITGSLNIVSEDFEIINSNGLNAEDKATYISGIINTESKHSMIPVSGFGHASSRTLENFSAEQIGMDSQIMCVESINPKKIDSGKYTIIFEPYSVGELLAFVVAHNFNFKIFTEKKVVFQVILKKR